MVTLSLKGCFYTNCFHHVKHQCIMYALHPEHIKSIFGVTQAFVPMYLMLYPFEPPLPSLSPYTLTKPKSSSSKSLSKRDLGVPSFTLLAKLR